MISAILIGLPVSMAVLGVYKRYVPARGVEQIKIDHLNDRAYALLDIRAYNMSNKKPAPEAFNLPISYFSRGYQEIPKKPIHLIAENKQEINLAARLLRKKGLNVVSYSLIEEEKRDKLDAACC